MSEDLHALKAALPSSPLVSVIIPAFNAGPFISEAIESVLAQTYEPIEVIVVDDGSTDDTAQRIQQFGSLITYYYQPNSGGCSGPRNYGIRRSRGELITAFDADDVMDADKIRRQVTFLQRHPNAGCVITDYRNFSRNGDDATTHFSSCRLLMPLLQKGGPELLLDGDTCTRILLEENFGSACAPMFRRSVLDAVGLYDETLKASEDFELQYRVSLASATGIVAHVGYRRRLHESNMSSNVPNILRYKIASRAKLLRIEPNRLHKWHFSRAISNWQWDLARYHRRRRHYRQAYHATVATLRYRATTAILGTRL